MRRQNSDMSKIVGAIIIIIVLVLIVLKVGFSNTNSKEYMAYVGKFEDALEKYADSELGDSYPQSSFNFSTLKENLITKGYLEKLDDESVTISGDDVIMKVEDGNLTYYNYSNSTTYENGFKINFRTKGGKEYTCTSNKCD